MAAAEIRVEDLGMRQPTLDEVFLTLTGTDPTIDLGATDEEALV
jgi:hypothetical protein